MPDSRFLHHAITDAYYPQIAVLVLVLVLPVSDKIPVP